VNNTGVSIDEKGRLIVEIWGKGYSPGLALGKKITLFGDGTYLKSWGTSIEDEMEHGDLTEDNLDELLRWIDE